MIHRLGVARSPSLAVPLPASLELDACYRYCEALVRARHHNYPVASMFARSQLLDQVWGDHVYIEERTVDVHVKRLREALGDAGSMVETVRGAGYRLTAQPQEQSN